MRVAISGHRGLPPDTELLVDTEIRGRLSAYSPDDLVGLSRLADGADQLFARAVVDAGGHLEAIVPAKKHRDALPANSRKTYDTLLGQAAEVHELDNVEANDQSQVEAGRTMLEKADRLFAVWDGEESGADGVADVVALARELEVQVTVVWPEGARRG